MWLAIILAILAAFAGGLWLLFALRRRRNDSDRAGGIDPTIPVSSKGARV